MVGLAGVFVDEVEELVVHCLLLFWRACTDGLRGAVGEVVAHERARDGAQGLLHGRDLCDDVGAVAVVFDHAVEAADLTFYETKTAEIRGLDFGIDSRGFAFKDFMSATVVALVAVSGTL